MRHAGMMRHRVTPQTRSTAKGSTGAPSDTFTALSPVWGHLKAVSEARQAGAGRYESPATHRLTTDGGTWAVTGNRVMVAGVTYDILGTDASGEQTQLDLKEVTR